jgi:dipeptidyl aminopeptidase/acylaminoacyl peptidase
MKRLLVGLLSNLVLAAAAQTKQPVTVTDMLNIQSIANTTLSRDGSKAAFTVTSIEPDGDSKLDYKYVTQIWVVPADGSSPARQLTTKENASQPAFSPDGKQLAFVRLADNKPQVFLLSLDGGEAIQLTKFKYGASTPKWSPDGKQLLFAANIPMPDLIKDNVLNAGQLSPAWPFEKPGFFRNEQFKAGNSKANPDGNLEEVRAYLNNNETDKKARVIDKLVFQDEMNINADLGFTHFFIIDARTGDTPQPVTKGFYSFNSADFTPDGKQLIFSADIDSLEHPDRSREDGIYIANRDGSNLRALLAEEGKVYTAPKISPSGKWIAFLYGDTSFVKMQHLAIMPLTGSVKDRITIPYDRTKVNLVWSADEKYLYFNSPSNGGVPLYKVNIQTKQVEQLTDHNSGISSFDVMNNKIAYVKTEVANPFELYLADANAKNAKRVTGFNYHWVQNKQLSFPEKKTFTNNKGQTVEYWVMKPTNYEAGKKYPLLLEIHGGPSVMWGPGETSMWHEYQFFCSKGYGVVYCNPRGSGGYGEEFMRANIKDWGDGPTSDVLTALDKTVAEGWADTSKLMVTGGSYAGYLVAWIIAHDHRFKAACSQRGVYDLPVFFGEGNAWWILPDYFGGYPWEPEVKAKLQRESPVNHVQHIITPYIIFHGDNDRRTGVAQSEILYRSLKVLNRPVEYVRHPNATHEITRSGDNRQRIDQMLRTWEFFERYIR